eukprot:CAMPEP_0174943946 /NCGR_PEP_ID=MMETSP1355-20121228/77980_1 /TAXON_ID=464990 /ORGANISM="Hemiselmis tepida, Strain CCMP443" /LENGTH=36 /DNA_ID= /DNA_START= /DNA_END= /DNA_ORIENTATION=
MTSLGTGAKLNPSKPQSGRASGPVPLSRLDAKGGAR